jgi:hypothetical protein
LTSQKKPKQSKECLIGLSPIALCRIQFAKLSFVKIEYSLTQSKMLLVARCAPNLYECALSTSNADFRLYEFLKNSRSKYLLRDQTTMLSNNKSPHTAFMRDNLLLNILVEDDGIEPTTPCLQSRCSPS